MCKLAMILALLAAALPGASDSFRLSMDKVKATTSALKGMAELLSSDAGLRARYIAAKKQLPDTNGRDSLNMTADVLISKEPRIAAVYRSAGISPKEAGMTMETLLGVMMGVGMLEASGKKDAQIPEGFVAENVEFYKAHKAEIQQVLGELKNVKGSIPDDEDEDEDEDEK